MPSRYRSLPAPQAVSFPPATGESWSPRPESTAGRSSRPNCHIFVIAYPSISLLVETIIQRAYGVLLLLTLVSALPHARRYFLSERWGGYGQRGLLVDAVQNPI